MGARVGWDMKGRGSGKAGWAGQRSGFGGWVAFGKDFEIQYLGDYVDYICLNKDWKKRRKDVESAFQSIGILCRACMASHLIMHHRD